MATPFTLILMTVHPYQIRCKFDPVYYFCIPQSDSSKSSPPLGINLAKLSENSHYKLDIHIRVSDCDVDIKPNFKSTFARICFFIGKYQIKGLIPGPVFDVSRNLQYHGRLPPTLPHIVRFPWNSVLQLTPFRFFSRQ